jgi:pentatricopeptide repeat protein
MEENCIHALYKKGHLKIAKDLFEGMQRGGLRLLI